MSKIKEIYSEAYARTPAALADDNAVGEAVNEQVKIARQQNGGALSEEEWSDLVCLGTSYGQEQGFKSGFKYALSLIFESLSD